MGASNSFILPCARTLCLQWHYQTASHCSGQQDSSRNHDKVLRFSVPWLPVQRLWECVVCGQWERLCHQWHLRALQSSKPALPQSDWMGGKWDLWITPVSANVRQPQTDYSYTVRCRISKQLGHICTGFTQFSSPACRMYCLQISVFHKTGVLNVLSMTWYSRTHDFIFLMF